MYTLGQVVETKKTHVCGNALWTVVRTGADIKLECNQCKRVVMISGFELTKKLKNKK